MSSVQMMKMKLILVALLCFCSQPNQARIVHVSGDGHYSLSYSAAYQRCSKLGGSLANLKDLQLALRDGYSVCSCGWLADKTSRFPINVSLPPCGGRPGIHECTWRNKWNAYCFLGDVLPRCSRPLGIEMRGIPDHSMTSLTANYALIGQTWTADQARLNRQGLVNAWMPSHDGRNQYLQVDLGRITAVSGIITQGAKRYLQPQYVTKFWLEYSKDGRGWTKYKENKVVKLFDGNTDNNGHVRNMFSTIALTRFVRYFPHSWHGHITVRLELLGCDLATYDVAMEEQRESSIPGLNSSLK